MENISLDGKWRLYYFPQGKYSIIEPKDLKRERLSSIEAVVPGNVELDLVRVGELPEDLFFGENIHKLKPYEVYEWWYEYEFPTPNGITDRKIELNFHGVDALATYWLNNMKIGESDNMFIEHKFDISTLMVKDKFNILTIRLRSPLIEAAEKQIDPYNGLSYGETNIEQTWIRKAAHSYGWDIMPRAMSAGLWRKVEILIYEEHEIRETYFFTSSISRNKAILGVFYRLDSNLLQLSDMELKIKGVCGNSNFEVTNPLLNIGGNIYVEIENPKLWYPTGYGKANLYEVTIELICKGRVLARKQEIVGLRTVEVLRSDTTSLDNPGQFLFKINGTPILCKGSNWVSADVFHSRDAQRYDTILELFKELGCNMVRCWGGNVYEDHEFFKFCDQNGIMVWQDFTMACALYPQTTEFLETIRQEAESVVRKLRNHPSLVIWCGDNECDENMVSKGIDPSHNKITREVLPAVITRCDPYRHYLPSSPYYSPTTFEKNQNQIMPERHLWGPRDYYKSSFYTENTAHFISEIGYHGCPNLSSIKRFIDDEHLWPWQQNQQWITHATAVLGSKSNYALRIKLMADQVQELFGKIPEDIEDFIMASQISQAEAKKFFIEMVRLKKWRRTGIIWWNMMDGWPQFSDAVVDYYFGKKLAYYYIKRVQQPICIMIDEPENWHLKVVVGNDSLEDANGQFKIWDADTKETLLEGDFTSKANENIELGLISVYHSDKKLLLIQWTLKGKVYGNHYLLGFPGFSFYKYKEWLGQIAKLMEADFGC